MAQDRQRDSDTIPWMIEDQKTTDDISEPFLSCSLAFRSSLTQPLVKNFIIHALLQNS